MSQKYHKHVEISNILKLSKKFQQFQFLFDPSINTFDIFLLKIRFLESPT